MAFILASALISCRCAALQMDHASLLKQFEHLDPHNQNTFEAKDLELLISTVRDSAHLSCLAVLARTRYRVKARMLALTNFSQRVYWHADLELRHGQCFLHLVQANYSDFL